MTQKEKFHTFDGNYSWLAADFMKLTHELRWPAVMHEALLM